jgi:polyisoprenoid-binding protein YceI
MSRFTVRLAIYVLALATFNSAPFAQSTEWQIDLAHSSAQFQVRHMMVSTVRGTFSKMTGTIQYDPSNLSKTAIEATIDAASVDTHEPSRDSDLRGPDFFDVTKFPTLTFKSKRAESAGPGKIKLTGDLTMHGVTKEVVFDVEGPSASMNDGHGNLHMGASATAKVNRKDFGLNWNHMLDNGGAIVGDEVTITIDVELVSKAPAAAR